MTTSELIRRLQTLLDAHGDLLVLYEADGWVADTEYVEYMDSPGLRPVLIMSPNPQGLHLRLAYSASWGPTDGHEPLKGKMDEPVLPFRRD